MSPREIGSNNIPNSRGGVIEKNSVKFRARIKTNYINNFKLCSVLGVIFDNRVESDSLQKDKWD
jgi:hypothetical protein